jgi:hypothetical protein
MIAKLQGFLLIYLTGKDLNEDLKSFKDYDTILCELKAASVDVVTDFAFKNGIRS